MAQTFSSSDVSLTSSTLSPLAASPLSLSTLSSLAAKPQWCWFGVDFAECMNKPNSCEYHCFTYSSIPRIDGKDATIPSNPVFKDVTSLQKLDEFIKENIMSTNLAVVGLLCSPNNRCHFNLTDPPRFYYNLQDNIVWSLDESSGVVYAEHLLTSNPEKMAVAQSLPEFLTRFSIENRWWHSQNNLSTVNDTLINNELFESFLSNLDENLKSPETIKLLDIDVEHVDSNDINSIMQKYNEQNKDIDAYLSFYGELTTR